jgi:hypothetical protein
MMTIALIAHRRDGNQGDQSSQHSAPYQILALRLSPKPFHGTLSMQSP